MKLKTLAAATLLVVSAAAQAAAINAPSATFAGTVIDFNSFDGFILPQVNVDDLSLVTRLDLGNGVNFSATAFAELGSSNADLGQNGAWTTIGTTDRDGTFVSSQFEDGAGAFSFSFATGMQMVGIFANQFQAAGEPAGSILLSAFAANGVFLESQVVSFDAAPDSYDQGKFVGFKRNSADIRSFVMVSDNMVVDNLTVTAVPEPETWAMMVAGLGLVGWAAARRRKVVSA